MKSIRLLLIFAVLFYSCNQNQDNNEVRITFLQLNDVYELSAVSGGKLGGFARVQTLLNQLKSENKNTFSFMAGDMLSPSAIGTAQFEGERIAGRQMVDALNAMNWDYFTFGNHEFDIKEPDLRKRLQEMQFTLITDNVTDQNDQPFPNTVPHQIINVDGVKVGIFGVTLNNFRTKYAKISDPIEAAQKAVGSLKQSGADIIVGLTHQSIDQDEALVVEIPEIDLVMGGHEHENFHLLRGNNFTPIAKADANAKTAFVHQLTFNKETKALNIKSELVFIDDQLQKDGRILELANTWTKRAFESFEEQGYDPNRVICQSTRILDGSESAIRNRSTALTKLITRGFLSAFPQADAAIMNGGSIRIDDKLQPGPITEYDIMKISPFGGSVSQVTIDGATLIRALDQGEKNAGNGAFIQYANISKQEGSWLLQEAPIEPGNTYTIAISSYMVEKGDTNLEFLTYDKGLVKPTDQPKQKFFDIVIAQFQKEFN